MLKYLEVPDLHCSPMWIDTIERVLDRVIEQAVSADFVVFPGDMHDCNMYLTDAYNRFQDKIRELLAIRPCCAVSGTPGRHEVESMYGPLEKIGLVLLRPGRVYIFDHGKIYEQRPGHVILHTAQAVLFGVPELTKQSIQADLKLPADEANAHAEKLFRRYIIEFVAPQRARFAHLPAIGVLHGTVTDYSRETEMDVKKKSASIVISTDDLEPSNMTRWSLGHIHTPWESRKICAGYAGSWGQSWKETGFVPAMNVVETHSPGIDWDCKVGFDETLVTTEHHSIVDIARIPYGTPQRIKINLPLSIYDPSVAYWLHTTVRDAPIPSGHSWSRVTYDEEKTTVRRVTQDQAQGATLDDLFKLADPTIHEKTIELVNELEKASPQSQSQPREISVDYVAIDGCIFWQGQSIELDASALRDGLTQIIGANGEGKSSLAAFCSPYPCVIGKDTQSGRTSAIKDFFSGAESKIEKHLTVNGVRHDHLITIRGAHTQTPKVECYLSIEGKPQLQKSTFDEMFEKCEELYGAFDDYILTTFYVQPLQGKQGSSLMSAGMTDIRNLVQHIAGVDREAQKEISLSKVKTYTEKTDEKIAWLKGAAEFAIDPEPVRAQLKKLVIDEASKLTHLEAIKDSGLAAKKELDELLAMQRDNDVERVRKGNNEKRINELSKKMLSTTESINTLIETASHIEEKKQMLARELARQSRMSVRDKLVNDNAQKKNDYDSLVLNWNQKLGEEQLRVKVENNKKKNEAAEALSYYNSKILEYDTIISANNKPCHWCGKLDPDAEAKIGLATIGKNSLCRPVAIVLAQIPSTILDPLPEPPSYNEVADSEPQICNADTVRAEIDTASNAQANINSLEMQIEDIEKEIAELASIVYNISTTMAIEVESASQKRQHLQDEYSKARAELSSIQTNIENTQKAISKIETDAALIAQTRELLATESDLLERWKYIAVMLRPDKIPAMELELVLDLIDAEATRNIEPYMDGRYSFSTRTQKQGKKTVVDDFDIRIHDNETGHDKSFLAFSPGQKAFLNDAYVKALIRVRNNRAHITYSPIISDEADGPIQPEMVSEYYEMQKQYYEGTEARVLVISHAPDARNYITNHISIGELKK